MGTKINKKTENEDQAVSETKELYQNILNQQEALKNLLIAIEKQDSRDDLFISGKDIRQK